MTKSSSFRSLSLSLVLLVPTTHCVMYYSGWLLHSFTTHKLYIHPRINLHPMSVVDFLNPSFCLLLKRVLFYTDLSIDRYAK